MSATTTYCKRCVLPSSAAFPLNFDENGVCTGCLVHDQRDKIDWDKRGAMFAELVDEYRSDDNYDVEANQTHAANLKGKLMLAHGGMDSNVPPYNTYLVSGLPPTPISGVRLLSLSAAAEPADTVFFFYVLVDSDGAHGFSATLEEHNAKKEQARADGVIP